MSNQVRNLIIKDCKRGDPQRKIAKKYEVSKSAVQKLYKKFLRTGTVADQPGRGRKRITTSRDDAQIVRIIKKNPMTTVRNVRESLKLSISDRTVRRRLREADFQSRFARKRPFINKINKKSGLNSLKNIFMSPRHFGREFYGRMKVNLNFLDANIGFVCGEKVAKSFKIVTYKKLSNMVEVT